MQIRDQSEEPYDILNNLKPLEFTRVIFFSIPFLMYYISFPSYLTSFASF